MLKLDTEINLDIRPFFHWWGNQLLTLIPVQVRDRLIHPRERLILSVQQDYVTLALSGKQRLQQLGEFSLDATGSERRLELFESNPSLHEAEIVLRLSPHDVLRRVFSFPAAAAENLDQVVAFEMDRLTPFKADQVYHQARPVEKNARNDKIDVELVLVLRDKLDDILDRLSAWGLMPEVVDVQPDVDEGMDSGEVRYNLLPQHMCPKRNHWVKALNVFLGVILSLFVLLGFGMPIWFDRQWMLELQQQVEEAERTAKEVQSLKMDVDRRMHESVFVLEKKQQAPILIDVLNELSRIIPDKTWLTNLQYKNRRIQIQGQSPSASALIEIIEASPAFQQTRFVSPVTRDRKTKLERFQIATEVVNRGQIDQAADG
jgi:general secretion pathway protein L